MKKVFVACGGSNPRNQEYLSVAYEIGKFLAQEGYEYGQGGYVQANSLMGSSYVGYVQNGGKDTTFIVMQVFIDDIKGHEHNSKQIIKANNPNELMQSINDYADVEIFLPGGNGTLHEITSALESKDIIGSKANLILLNINGYYDKLIDLYKSMQEQGLLNKEFLNKHLSVVNSLEELFELMSRCYPCDIIK